MLGSFFKGRLYNFMFRMISMTLACFCRYVLCLSSSSSSSSRGGSIVVNFGGIVQETVVLFH